MEVCSQWPHRQIFIIVWGDGLMSNSKQLLQPMSLMAYGCIFTSKAAAISYVFFKKCINHTFYGVFFFTCLGYFTCITNGNSSITDYFGWRGIIHFNSKTSVLNSKSIA